MFEFPQPFHIRLYFGLRPLTRIEMSTFFYNNGLGDLCSREQQSGVMLNPLISVHVLYYSASFQLSISVCFMVLSYFPSQFLLIQTILRDIQN